MYTHTRAYINVYAYIYTDIHIYIYIHIHMHLYTHTCTHIYIKLPNARPPALPPALQGGTTRKQRARNLGKIQAEFTRLTSVVGGHPLPIIKNCSLLVELSALQRGVQELCDTCKIDGIPLQEESATDIILQALTKVVKATQSILL